MMKYLKSILILATSVTVSVGAAIAIPFFVNAYAPERAEYTIAEINAAYQDGTWSPDKIVFNSISDSVIGHEFNFVGARECTVRADGRCDPLPEGEYWSADEITVEDGKTYLVRLYVHNNNPYGMTDEEKSKASAQEIANSDAGTAQNVKAAFTVPYTSANEVEVDGFIRTTSGEIPTYLDSVKFISQTGKFHLEYVYGSALLENNGIGAGGYTLSDDVVNTQSGTLIGYDKLDGRIPGCYEFDSCITIQVKAIFDYDFTIENEVRLADSIDKSWHKAVEAKVGDKVEFLIGYYNTSDFTQTNVAVRDYLPNNLKYIEGSIKLKNSNHPNGVSILEDNLVENGIIIGSYGPGANAYVMFTAEVVDKNLADGANSLVNYIHGGVGYITIEDSATVHVMKMEHLKYEIFIFITIFLLCLTAIIILQHKIRQQKKNTKNPS